MIKKTITYEDYDKTERTEDFYFNLNESEIVKMEMVEEGGYTEKINKIINSKDTPSIVSTFEEIIKKAYGEKSPNGREFIKDEALTKKFMSTEAYNKLFMELITVPGAAAEFVNGIISSVSNNVDVEPTT